MIESLVGVTIIVLSMVFFILFVFGDDLDLKDKIEIMCAFAVFFIGLAVGAYLITGGK